MPECDMTLFDNHEAKSKERYCNFQQVLDKITNDDTALKILADKVDIQLKLEDYLIKAREAGHAKFFVWSPLFVGIFSAAISAIVSFAVAWLHK